MAEKTPEFAHRIGFLARCHIRQKSRDNCYENNNNNVYKRQKKYFVIDIGNTSRVFISKINIFATIITQL